MEKTANRWESPLVRCAAAALGCCVLLPVAGWAQDANPPQQVVVAQARTEPSMRVEVNASSVPHLDGQESFFQSPRVDLSLASQKNDSLGVVLGMGGIGARPSLQANTLAPSPSMDLGLRWRQAFYSKQVDVTAWRRMSADQDAYTLIQQRQPVYGARVEMKLDSAKPGFATGNGFLGFQLESGAKITVRRKEGRPMIYYRSSF